MGLDKEFLDKAFSNGKDRVNRAIMIPPQELLLANDDDITKLGEALFYLLPRNQFVEENKDDIREKFGISGNMPTIKGVPLPTAVKLPSWRKRKIGEMKVSDLLNMFD